jgi:hypothetical protein
MILKKIYSQNKKFWENSSNKKLLSKNLYNKFLIRSSLLENEQFNIIDNNNNFFNTPSTNLRSFISLKSNNSIIGASFYAKNIIYTNQFNNLLQFNSFVVNNKSSSFSFIDSFYNLLKISVKEISSSLFLLNPVKGGFICYSSGIIGFLPRSQGVSLFSTALLNFKNKSNKTTILENLKFLINKNYFINNFFGLRLPHWWGKTVSYHFFNKKKMVKSKKGKFSSHLSFVFLSQKSLLKNKKLKNYEK